LMLGLSLLWSPSEKSIHPWSLTLFMWIFLGQQGMDRCDASKG
jgi:hypothetical protein